MFDFDWRLTLETVLRWAATNPWEFIFYVLMGLSPFFFISAILAWNLAKQIEVKEKEKKKKARREAAIKKATKKAQKAE